MPVKDLVGPPRPTAEEKALLIALHRRLGVPLSKRPGYRDEGGLEPVPTPFGTKPVPIAGGAAARFE
jgi:hypothetical protein